MPIHIKSKVKFAKKFFSNSISSVQPFEQDNLEGSIRQPCLKVEQLCAADDNDIFSSISSKSSLNSTLSHKAFKTTFKKPKKPKNVIMNNKSTNSKFIGFEELPKAAKTYFEKIYERNTQRLLSYGKVLEVNINLINCAVICLDIMGHPFYANSMFLYFIF